MKIVYVIRADYLTQLGGDSIQMMKTKEYMEKMRTDLEIEICNHLDIKEAVENADIVHIFNLQTIEFSYTIYQLCQKYNCIVFLSPIFWDLKDSLITSGFYTFFNLKPQKWMKVGNNIIWKLLIHLPQFNQRIGIFGKEWGKAKEILENVDGILPNSYEELEQICRIFKLDYEDMSSKSNIIPNAIEKDSKDIKNPENARLPSNYVLQVGRIGTVKNQIKVLQALKKKKEIPIVFIGKPENRKYYNMCRKLAHKRGNVFFIESVPHNEMDWYYQNAICHVNPSFRESPGLASMEALYNGLPIVTSDEKYCPCKFYRFNEIAYLCEPYSTNSIKKAILKAMDNSGKQIVLKDYFNFFSYQTVAKMTLDAYKKCLDQRKQ